jgi:hypothetical protein
MHPIRKRGSRINARPAASLSTYRHVIPQPELSAPIILRHEWPSVFNVALNQNRRCWIPVASSIGQTVEYILNAPKATRLALLNFHQFHPF